MELRLPATKGLGGAPLYLISRFEEGRSIDDIDFDVIDGVDRHPVGHGVKLADHLTHNVDRGRMAHWAGFHETLFNFRKIRCFDIQGTHTGLTSKAMTAPDGKLRIPLNEQSSLRGGSTEALKTGGPPRLLLQNFSATAQGPVIFEFIHRQGDDGFGEGNFKALFASLERDQIRRGARSVGG